MPSVPASRGTGMPVRPDSWVATMYSAAPVVKPDSTGWLMKWVSQPSFSAAIASRITPLKPDRIRAPVR